MNDTERFIKAAKELIEIVDKYYGDTRVVHKPPCSHSPMGRMYGLKEILDLPADHKMEFICKHCLVALEPTGWREINSGNADNKTK